MKLEIRFIASLFFAIIVAIFAIQNAGSIEVNFFFWNFTVSQAIVIFGAAIIGGIIVLLLGLIKQIRQSRKIKRLTEEVDTLKLQLEEFRKEKFAVEMNEEMSLQTEERDDLNKEQDLLDDPEL